LQTKVVEKITTRIFLFNNFSENRAVYDTWKNMLEPRRLWMTI